MPTPEEEAFESVIQEIDRKMEENSISIDDFNRLLGSPGNSHTRVPANENEIKTFPLKDKFRFYSNSLLSCVTCDNGLMLPGESLLNEKNDLLVDELMTHKLPVITFREYFDPVIANICEIGKTKLDYWFNKTDKQMIRTFCLTTPFRNDELLCDRIARGESGETIKHLYELSQYFHVLVETNIIIPQSIVLKEGLVRYDIDQKQVFNKQGMSVEKGRQFILSDMPKNMLRIIFQQ
jgi:hypothetical protein